MTDEQVGEATGEPAGEGIEVPADGTEVELPAEHDAETNPNPAEQPAEGGESSES